MRARGYTLIEVVVTLAILGILLALAVPAFAQWIGNVRIRSQAESIQNGLRQARQEAIKQNRAVAFALTAAAAPTCTSTASTSGANWIVCTVGNSDIDGTGVTPTPIGIGYAHSTSLAVTADFSKVTFNGMGRTDQNEIKTIDISNGQTCETQEDQDGKSRCLKVLLAPAGKVRMCDPMLDSGSPAACPEED